MARRPITIGLVSSVGGHLRELLQLRPVLEPYDVFIILNDATPVALPWRSYRIAHAERDLRVLWNLAELAPILRRERPRLLLSAGAGPAVPAFLIGRLLSARLAFIETFGAVERPTLTGRLLYPICHDFFYQWPGLRRFYPRGHQGGAIFRPTSVASDQARSGTLITVGTSLDPFDRLLRMTEALFDRGLLPQPVLAQVGRCRVAPTRFPTKEFLPADELEGHLARARLVICHAGAGTIGTCLTHGQRPVVVPRRARHGEIVNDHQLELCRHLSEAGQILWAEDEAGLAEAVERTTKEPVVLPSLPGGQLADQIAALLRQVAAE